jgi:hypothetical protein
MLRLWLLQGPASLQRAWGKFAAHTFGKLAVIETIRER